MQTPEVRDIIYRRFVTKDFGNDLEKMLLKSASMSFVVKQGYDAQYCTRLSLGLHIAALIITGELRSVDDFDWQRFVGLYANFFKSA